MCGAAFRILAGCLAGLHGPESAIGRALGRDLKGRVSLGLYGIVAAMWMVPDRRIERALTHPA